MKETKDVLNMSNEEYLDFCKRDTFSKLEDVKRFYLFDYYTNVYRGHEDVNKDFNVEGFYKKPENSTDIKPDKPKEGFIPVFNTFTNEWMEIKDTLGEIYYDFSGEPLYLNLDLKESPATTIRPTFYKCCTFNPDKQEWVFEIFSFKSEIYNYFANELDELKDRMLKTKCGLGDYVVREEVLKRILTKITGLELTGEEVTIFQDSYGESRRLNIEDLKKIYSEIFTVINKMEIKFEDFLNVFDKIKDEDIGNPQSDFHVFYIEFKDKMENLLSYKEKMIRLHLNTLKSNMNAYLESL